MPEITEEEPEANDWLCQDNEESVEKIRLKTNKGESTAAAKARVSSSPVFNAALTLTMLNGKRGVPSAEPDLKHLVEYLHDLTKSEETGESTLLAQASTLDQLFNHMLRIAFEGGCLEQWDMWLKFAMRAQSQCRNTYQAISDIRHPRVQYVKEQYNAAGHMQVNNKTHTGNSENQPNELTEDPRNALCQNASASAGSCRAEPDSQAVVEINRSKNGRRQANSRS